MSSLAAVRELSVSEIVYSNIPHLLFRRFLEGKTGSFSEIYEPLLKQVQAHLSDGLISRADKASIVLEALKFCQSRVSIRTASYLARFTDELAKNLDFYGRETNALVDLFEGAMSLAAFDIKSAKQLNDNNAFDPANERKRDIATHVRVREDSESAGIVNVFDVPDAELAVAVVPENLFLKPANIFADAIREELEARRPIFIENKLDLPVAGEDSLLGSSGEISEEAVKPEVKAEAETRAGIFHAAALDAFVMDKAAIKDFDFRVSIIISAREVIENKLKIVRSASKTPGMLRDGVLEATELASKVVSTIECIYKGFDDELIASTDFSGIYADIRAVIADAQDDVARAVTLSALALLKNDPELARDIRDALGSSCDRKDYMLVVKRCEERSFKKPVASQSMESMASGTAPAPAPASAPARQNTVVVLPMTAGRAAHEALLAEDRRLAMASAAIAYRSPGRGLARAGRVIGYVGASLAACFLAVASWSIVPDDVKREVSFLTPKIPSVSKFFGTSAEAYPSDQRLYNGPKIISELPDGKVCKDFGSRIVSCSYPAK